MSITVLDTRSAMRRILPAPGRRAGLIARTRVGAMNSGGAGYRREESAPPRAFEGVGGWTRRWRPFVAGPPAQRRSAIWMSAGGWSRK